MIVMSKIEKDQPSQLDIDEMELDKKASAAIFRVFDAEESAARAVQDLGAKLQRSAIELQSYYDISFEISRNYIQLTNRNSDIISPLHLQKIKEHLKRLETSLANQKDVYNTMFELESAYSDYAGGVRELGKSWDNLLKKQASWRDADYELKKAQAKQSYEKYDKIEQNIRKGKAETIKALSEKDGKDSFVSSAVVRLNQAWNALKMKIKNISW